MSYVFHANFEDAKLIDGQHAAPCTVIQLGAKLNSQIPRYAQVQVDLPADPVGEGEIPTPREPVIFYSIFVKEDGLEAPANASYIELQKED